MNKDEYIEFCRTIPGAVVDQPFTDDFLTYTARHMKSRKWFGVIMELDGSVFVNLKCDPLESDFLRSVYEGITPAYHMNKLHWSSVCLSSDVPDELIIDLTLKSFHLTETKVKRKAMLNAL